MTTAAEHYSRMDASQAPMPYRSDIDGLRAIAVLSVVLYHFGFPLQGGFVGVDIFFVISGFLIGGILWREYDQFGRIRLLHFYVRRFKRLAPAFFVMLAVTTLFGWALLLPFEFREYGKTVIASTVYLSNVLFFRGAGYFDTASEEKPLLHTWSLAVEEQFYIFLPLMILFLARWRYGLLSALVVIWAGSLAACVLLTPSNPTATFYLFPFRAWELLTGVLLAIWGYETGRLWRGYAVLSWLGLALIAVSIVVIPAGPMFPGIYAILPVLGSALLLANGTSDNMINRFLCHRWMVFFGLISYSFYLWHWPVFTLSSYLRDGYSGLPEAVLWMALSVALAWLSWKFVENPVRHAKSMPNFVVLGGVLCASVAALAVGGLLYVKDGIASRFGPEARVHIGASGDFLQDWSRCYIAEDLPLDGLELCPIGPDGAPKLLIWGDSHVRAYREGLNLAAIEADVPALIIWRAGCPPMFDIRKTESAATQAQDDACRQANMQIKQAFGRLDSVESVLLIGRWAYYAEGRGVGLDAHNTIRVHPANRGLIDGQSQSAFLVEAAADTITQMAPWVDNIHVLRQGPEVPNYDSRKAARETAHAGWPLAAHPVTEAKVDRGALALRAALADAPWLDLAETGRIGWVDPWPMLCDAEICSAVHDGVGHFFDNNHVTNEAALRLRGMFAPVFESVKE